MKRTERENLLRLVEDFESAIVANVTSGLPVWTDENSELQQAEDDARTNLINAINEVTES